MDDFFLSVRPCIFAGWLYVFCFVSFMPLCPATYIPNTTLFIIISPSAALRTSTLCCVLHLCRHDIPTSSLLLSPCSTPNFYPPHCRARVTYTATPYRLHGQHLTALKYPSCPTAFLCLINHLAYIYSHVFRNRLFSPLSLPIPSVSLLCVINWIGSARQSYLSRYLRSPASSSPLFFAS